MRRFFHAGSVSDSLTIFHGFPAIVALYWFLVGCEKPKEPDERADSATSDASVSPSVTKHSQSLVDDLNISTTPGPREAARVRFDRVRMQQRLGQDVQKEFSDAFRGWAEKDPKNALKLFKDPENMTRYRHWLPTVMDIVAKADPQILKDWLTGDFSWLPNKRHQAELTRSGLRSLGASSPSMALEVFKTLRAEKLEKTSMAESVFVGIATNDLALAMTEAAKLDPPLSDHALKGISNGYISVNQALDAARKISDPMIRADALRQIALINGTYQEGFDIAFTIDRTVVREQTLRELIPEWYRKDPPQATKAVQALDSSLRAEVFMADSSIIPRMIEDDPEAVVSSVMEIYPTAKNSDSFEKVVQQLAESHPEGAVRVISNLPESPLKTRLLEKIKPK